MEELVPLISKMLVIATILSVIVLALTYVIGDALKIKKRFKPLLSLILGVLLGLATVTMVSITLPVALWIGGIAGLVASGAYDNAKSVMDKRNKERAKEEESNGE